MEHELALLRDEVRGLRKELEKHVEMEMPVLEAIMREIGSPEQVRERRVFVEAWIERERVRARLRTAIIEKGLLIAVLAVCAFIGQAVYHEFLEAVKMMRGRGP